MTQHDKDSTSLDRLAKLSEKLISPLRARCCTLTGGRICTSWTKRRNLAKMTTTCHAIGATDGARLDEYAQTVPASYTAIDTASSPAEHQIKALLAPGQAALEDRAERATRRPTLWTLLLITVAATIIVAVDYSLNFGISARLGSITDTTARLVAVALAVIFPLGAHLLVMQIPPGRRHRIRTPAIAGLITGLLLIGLGGVFLRTRSTNLSRTSAGLNPTTNTGPSLGEWLSYNAEIIVFIGIFFTITATSALLTLHHALRARTAALDPHTADRHTRRHDVLTRIADSNTNQIRSAAHTWRAAYTQGLHTTAHPNAIDRLPALLPQTHQPQLDQ